MISGDRMMDLITRIPASKNRCRNMDRLKADQRGCECCGRALKSGAAVMEIETDLGMMPFGPECAKAMRIELDREEADRFRAARGEAETLSPFLAFLLERFTLAVYGANDRLDHATIDPERLLADYFKIDLDAVERHRAWIVASLRKDGR